MRIFFTISCTNTSMICHPQIKNILLHIHIASTKIYILGPLCSAVIKVESIRDFFECWKNEWLRIWTNDHCLTKRVRKRLAKATGRKIIKNSFLYSVRILLSYLIKPTKIKVQKKTWYEYKRFYTWNVFGWSRKCVVSLHRHPCAFPL